MFFIVYALHDVCQSRETSVQSLSAFHESISVRVFQHLHVRARISVHERRCCWQFIDEAVRRVAQDECIGRTCARLIFLHFWVEEKGLR
ncbi:hypothetical protein ASD28_04310 [Massilia sp. Root133]|nr:hypothetical protein ASD28_04310 [Massilia sp. Root133]KQZ34403.1 hypothetical protein ASD92_08860 [Massilia sp. Root1485]